MLGKEFIELMSQGIIPLIEFIKDVEEREIDPDEGMRCKVIGYSGMDTDGVFSLKCDYNGFEDYNKTFAKPDYYNENHNPVLTWFESKYYPKNGIDTIYLDADYNVPFKLVEENELYQRYKESNSELKYIHWLEEAIVSLEA